MADFTAKDVYNLVEAMRKELKADLSSQSSHILATVQRVENKFDTMEAGRLTKLEKDFAQMQGKMMASVSIFMIALQILFLAINKFL